MTRKLKVYHWLSFRLEARSDRNHHAQTDEYVAAHSKAEAARIAGYNRPAQMFNLEDTGERRALEFAASRPGIQFWKPIHPHDATFVEAR